MKVKVATRIRPLLPAEILQNQQVCVRVVPGAPQVLLARDRAFAFDFAFGPKAQQDEVYCTCVKPLVASLMDGYNVTVFAYGQTGSGKTYTIGAGHFVSSAEEERGIIPRAVQDIFQCISEKHNMDFSVKASYIEVYKEELRDLLELETYSKDIQIREDKGNTVLVGARETVVESADELLGVLEAGNAVRRTGTTQVNERSSRSHAIFTISLTQHNPVANHTLSSKFHLVDLAGSERVARTGNTGQRLQESAQINSGLLALGNVIRALGDSRKRGHVNYRDSKITRLLRDSLGGNAQTVMITCLSPSSLSFHETLSSLKFASCARAIQNKPVVNWDPGQERMGELELEVRTLREALRDREGGSQVSRDKREQSQAKARVLADQLAKQQQELLQLHNLTEDAAHLLLELRDSSLNPSMNPEQSQRLQEWLETHMKVLNQKSTHQPSSWKGAGEESQHITVVQLRRDLKKCQDALSIDEQVLSQKEEQLQQLQEQVHQLEQERQGNFRALLEERRRSRLQNEKLEEQQMLINQLRSDLRTSRTCTSEVPVEVGTSGNSVQRPHSVPLPNWLLTDSHNHGITGKRKVHTSPPAYSLERVVAAFKTRSQLLLAQIEENEEVLTQDMATDFAEENNKEEKNHPKSLRRSKNRTWTRRHSQNTHTGNGVDRQLPLEWGIPRHVEYSAEHVEFCYGSNPDTADGSMEEHALRSSKTVHLQHLKEAELRYCHAQQRIKELDFNIRLKEDLIKELVKTGKDAQAVNRHYAMKISQLEKEVEQGRNRQRRHSEGQGSSENACNMDQCDAQALTALSSQSERSRVEMELSVDYMRRQSERLQEQLREEADRRRSLQADITRDQQRIRELQLKFDKQKEALSENTEETTDGNNLELKDLEEQRLEEQRQWLDQAEEMVLQQRKTLAELQEELRQREEIISRREAFFQEKSHLEMKKMRSSQALNRDLLQVSSRLATVDQELEKKNAQLQGSPLEVRASLSCELDSLQQERERLHKRRDSLELKLKDGSVLTPEEEHTLFQLEEGLEALDAAIEYKNHTISSAQKLLKDTSQATCSTDIMGKLCTLSYPQVKALLLKYFNKVVFLREAERRLQLRCEELELQAVEQEGVVRELEAALQRLALDADRRLTEQQREHQHSMQQLLQQFQGSPSGGITESMKVNEAKIQQLEKDLFFYKMTSRELKKKLKELVKDCQITQCPSSQTQNQKPVDGMLHRSVKEGEDDGCRCELVPVRLSRKEVCQLSTVDLSRRRTMLAASSGSFQEDSLELSQKN
ncbi:kinesin-like protein KIF27 [Scleropages formosus]|uniref:kinesin-like protein KIF27 n=1 Tax=Scleropages formosus TaxID=113540 RepID=UPI0008785BBD|nr:kinesin-like protein KIF27 [Scleropages formosus]